VLPAAADNCNTVADDNCNGTANDACPTKTYAGDVQPILGQKCARCHTTGNSGSGGIPNAGKIAILYASTPPAPAMVRVQRSCGAARRNLLPVFRRPCACLRFGIKKAPLVIDGLVKKVDSPAYQGCEDAKVRAGAEDHRAPTARVRAAFQGCFPGVGREGVQLGKVDE